MRRESKNKEPEKEKTEALVKNAQLGDTDAFGELYDLYVDNIYRYIYFRVEREEALDLTENVFLKAWENLKSYKKVSNKYFSSWLYRIAHNIVIDHYRGRRETVDITDLNLPDEKRMNDPVVLTEQSLSHDALRKAVGKLNKKYRQLILLKYVSGLSNPEIAKVMGRSEGNLRILKFRALRALRQILENMNVKY